MTREIDALYADSPILQPEALEFEMIAKTITERVEKLRQERARLGVKRRELYVHDEDWGKIQELAAKLQAKREKRLTRKPG